MSDPYLLSSGACLRNKLKLDDAAKLKVLEAKVVSIRDVELARTTIPGEYNSQHLQAFHRHLFRDVYDWAGDFRTVDISKGNVRFAHWNYLNDSVSAVLGQLKDDYWLANLRRDYFIKRLAFYYGELNVCHPFREGNGRTQRAFLRQLSASAGWRLDWTELPPEGNIRASEHYVHTGRSELLVEILDAVVVKI